jgi:hypothetical protein
MRRFCLLTAALLSLWAQGHAATCTPISATLCVGVDDYADVWINGTCVATCAGTDFAYVDGSTSTPVPCVSVNPSILDPSGVNYVAVRVRNTNPTEMWGTWALDIQCADGDHSYITSNAPFQFYHDGTGTNPPAVDGAGKNWYDPAYSLSSSWGSPSVVTGSVYGKRAVDPATGQPLPPMSWDANGDGPGNDIMYFRQGFGLTPAPTPVPPVLSLSVIQPTCNADSGQSFSATLRVCNSGGNLTQTATVTLDRGSKLSFCGPYSPTGYTITQSGTQTILSIPFTAASSCVDYPICLVDYYVGPSDVGSVQQMTGSLVYPGGSDSGGASVVLGPSCVVLSPTITRTFTETPVALPTDTISPTFTATPSVSPPAATLTATPTFSGTPSASPTQSPGPSSTSTPTPSITSSFTPAPTAPPPTATPEPLLLTPKYPNPSPAHDSVYLPYVLTTAANVDIRIYDVSGELVLDLGPIFQQAGPNERRWDLQNRAGTQVASGIYLCRIIANAPDGESDEVWEKAAVTR